MLCRLAYDPQLQIEDSSVYSPFKGPIDTHPMLQGEGATLTLHDGPQKNYALQVQRLGYRLVPIL
mgnify:FL=1